MIIIPKDKDVKVVRWLVDRGLVEMWKDERKEIEMMNGKILAWRLSSREVVVVVVVVVVEK